MDRRFRAPEPDEGTDARTGGSVLFNETPSARWFVYRRQSPLDPAIEWSQWDDVRDGATAASEDLSALLKRNHARAMVAILDQSDWSGRGVHHCGVSPYPRPDAYVLVYAVRTDPQADAEGTVYYASPIPLTWMSGSAAVAP